jgi:hypothetical protein
VVWTAGESGEFMVQEDTVDIVPRFSTALPSVRSVATLRMPVRVL